MKWALLVHDSPDMAQLLSGIMADKLGLPDDHVVRVHNLADVRTQALERYGVHDCQLMAIAFSAPSDAAESRALEGNRTTVLAFFEDVRASKPALPFVFLSRVVDADTQALCAGFDGVSLLGVTNGLHRALPAAIGELVLNERPGVKKPVHEVDVHITLRLGGGSNWRIRGPRVVGLQDAEPFAITDVRLKELIRLSKIASSAKDPYLIGQVGREMYKALFADSIVSRDLEVKLARNIHLKDRNYLEAARFRFQLDSQTNQLLVETLAKPAPAEGEDEAQYWMLSTPIYRKYGGHGEREPLFKDRASATGPIDCLIIQGNAGRFSAPLPVGLDFDPIELARKEVDRLERYWTRRRADFRLDTVRVLRPETCDGPSYGKEVRRVLAERHWHLIHYAGHSSLVDARGYLVLGDGPDDVLDIDTFAQDARGAQFVFLNSCSSASGAFIARLVEKNIPAVAGYAWPLEDQHALAFSDKFYTELFEGEPSQRFLEYAFMRGKASLFERFNDKPAWAAPLLFMQTIQADRD